MFIFPVYRGNRSKLERIVKNSMELNKQVTNETVVAIICLKFALPFTL
jgi:hypothetical protein